MFCVDDSRLCVLHFDLNFPSLLTVSVPSDWEKLAASTKGIVTIAYWDTEGGSRPPRLLGEYQGTPTIRLFKPKKKQRNPKTHSEKLVLDYQHGERNVRTVVVRGCDVLLYFGCCRS